MNNFPLSDFDFLLNSASGQKSSGSVSLTKTAIPQKWCSILDRLSSAPLIVLGGYGTPSLYENLIKGNHDTFSSNITISLSGGCLVLRYKYRKSSPAELTLRGSVQSSQGGVHDFSRIDIAVEDPHFLFPLYVAQRQARASRGACELCGRPLSRAETRKKQWHHTSCYNFCPYSVEEESAVRETGSFCDGTSQIGANASASRNASNVENQNSAEDFFSRISRKFFNRR